MVVRVTRNVRIDSGVTLHDLSVDEHGNRHNNDLESETHRNRHATRKNIDQRRKIGGHLRLSPSSPPTSRRPSHCRRHRYRRRRRRSPLRLPSTPRRSCAFPSSSLRQTTQKQTTNLNNGQTNDNARRAKPGDFSGEAAFAAFFGARFAGAFFASGTATTFAAAAVRFGRVLIFADRQLWRAKIGEQRQQKSIDRTN